MNRLLCQAKTGQNEINQNLPFRPPSLFLFAEAIWQRFFTLGEKQRKDRAFHSRYDKVLTSRKNHSDS